MRISKHYNHKVSIQRFSKVSGYKKQKSTIISDLACHIQPLSAELLGSDGILGKDFLMFTDFVDIQEQDRVFDEKDFEYRVQGVEKFDFRGKTRHIEVRLRINNQPDK